MNNHEKAIAICAYLLASETYRDRNLRDVMNVNEDYFLFSAMDSNNLTGGYLSRLPFDPMRDIVHAVSDGGMKAVSFVEKRLNDYQEMLDGLDTPSNK